MQCSAAPTTLHKQQMLAARRRVQTQCAVYRHSVQCTDTVCSVQTQCAVYRHSVQCTDIVCSVRMAGSREVCSLEVFSVHWDVCILHYVVCSVRCAVSSVMCAVCSVQFAELVLK